MTREKLKLNIERISLEDRRLLLEKNSSEYMFNEQMLASNTTIILAFFAFFISSISIIISINIDLNLKIISIILILSCCIYLLSILCKARLNIKEDQEVLKKEYDILFKSHFDYAINKKELRK